MTEGKKKSHKQTQADRQTWERGESGTKENIHNYKDGAGENIERRGAGRKMESGIQIDMAVRLAVRN